MLYQRNSYRCRRRRPSRHDVLMQGKADAKKAKVYGKIGKKIIQMWAWRV